MSATKRRDHKRYPGDPTEAAQARLVDHVLAALGAAVSREQAQRLLEQARVWTFIPMRQLDQHLAAHPHALTAPDPFAPRALLRLLAALNAAGFAEVIPLPRCAGCQRTSADLVRCGRMHPDGIGRCCQACILKVESIVCARCGNEGIRSARRPEGVICRSCYHRDPERRELCTSCGRKRTPNQRTDDGQPLCHSCAPRPVHPCAECGHVAPAHVVTATGRVCRRCYQAPQRACGGCGRIRRIIKRGDGIRPDLCSSCKQTPVTACGVCGRFRRCRRGSDGVDRCQGCTPRPERVCGICSQQRTTHAFWPLGPVCNSCYRKSIVHPRPCGNCRQVRVLVDRRTDGAGLCGQCAMITPQATGTATVGQANIDYLCRSCRAGGDLYAAGRCSRCVLTDRITDLLGDTDGIIKPELLPLADALTNAPLPINTLTWLGRGSTAHTLAQLAATDGPVTHDHLDQIAPAQDRGGIGHLRKLLVATDVLPERVEALAQLEPWLDRRLAGQPVELQRLIRPFAQWAVLRKARRDAARGRYTQQSARSDREQIRHALLLLTWLHDRGLTLDDLTQPRLDAWILEGSRQRRQVIRAFVTWTAARRLTAELEIARQRNDEPTRFLDEEHHLDLLRRCLTDDNTLPIEVKVAGALILLYGVRVAQIHALTTSRITHADNRSYITFDANPVLLPPNLAILISRLIADPPRTTTTFRPAPDTRPTHLFPGKPATLPMSAASLGARLRQHGIQTAAGRNSALITLAADIPAPILADLFGIHPSTAAAWSIYARADWSDYLISRPIPAKA